MRVLDTGLRGEALALAFSPDGARLAVGIKDKGAAVHDLSDGRAPVALDDGTHFFSAHLGFGASGRVVYGITQNGRVGFDPATGRPVENGPAHPSLPGLHRGFVEAADGSRLVTTHFDHPTTRLVGWVAGVTGWEHAWVAAVGNSSSAALAGDRVVHIGCVTPGEWDHRLLVRDAGSGELLSTGAYGYAMLTRPRLRPDGRQVVATHEQALLVWDTRMPAEPARVRNDSRRKFTAAAYHPSGRYLFTTSYDATVTVWDTDSWARVKRFDWDIGRLRSVAVSPDGLLAAAGSDRGRVVVWDVDV